MNRTDKSKFYLAASIALLTFIVYLPALRNGFIEWDDIQYIVENPAIVRFDPAFLRWSFFGFHVSNWHPLTWLSHALDYALWGLNPVGHHLTSIIFHAANTAIVVLLSLKLFEIVRERPTLKSSSFFLSDKTALVAAGVTGLLFGIHPVHVESVAWVSERKDLLCALFFLLSIMSYVRYAGSGEPGAVSRKSEGGGGDGAGRKDFFTSKHYLLALVFFVLALMSKPMAVSLPAVLLILDWHPLGRVRSWKTLWSAGIEKLPFIAFSLASAVLTVLAQKAGGAMVSSEVVPLSTRLLVAVRSLAVYIQKMLLPLNFMPLYPYPKGVSPASFEYVSAILLVTGITAAGALLARRQMLWLSVWGYYVITLTPVLGIIQVGNQPMADRYLYLPSLGPFLLAGAGAAWVSEKMFRDETRGPLRRGVAVIAGFLLVLCLSYLTVRQTAVWKDSLSLWTSVIEKGPVKIPLAYNNRGMVFLKAGNSDLAIADFNQAIAADPEYAKAYYNRGSAYDKMGAFYLAIADYRKTISLDPFYYEAYYHLDQALKKEKEGTRSK